MSLEDTDAVFQPTRWALLSALHTQDRPARDAAMRSLVQLYWPPVYAYIRCHGRGRDESVELTQAFFADVVLERKLFDRADQLRGRLRSYLITVLKRFLTDEHRHRTSRAALNAVPLDFLADEDRALIGASDSPSEMFDRRWALLMLERALHEARRQFNQSGRQAFWSAFQRRDLQPSISGAAPEPLVLIAADLGFESSGHAAAAVQAVRKRIAALLRLAVAETIESPSEQEDEFGYLVRILDSSAVRPEAST